MAGEAVTSSPKLITGTGNTEAQDFRDVHGLTLELAEGAALNVKGRNEAVLLGYGASVHLEEGATIVLETDADGPEPVRAICINGDNKDSDNTVNLAKGAAVEVASTKAKDTSAIHIMDADNAHVSLDDARVTAKASDGEVYGVRLEKVTMSNTAKLAMGQGSFIDVSGKAAPVTDPEHGPRGDATGVYIDHVARGVVSLSGGSGIKVIESSSLEDAFMCTDGVEIENAKEAEVALDGQSFIRASAVSSGIGGDAFISGVEIEAVTDLTVRLDGQSTIHASANASGEEGRAGVSGMEVGDTKSAEVVLDGQSLLSASATGSEAVVTAFHLDRDRTEAHLGLAILSLASVSGVEAEASGANASAGGAIMEDTDHGVVKVVGGSHITATATARATGVSTKDSVEEDSSGMALAAATVLGMQNVATVEMGLTQATLTGTMTATDTRTETGDARAEIGLGSRGILPVGIGAVGYTDADILLTDSEVKVTANATASAKDGRSTATVGEGFGSLVSGLLVMPGDMRSIALADGESSALMMPVDHTVIRLDRSTIEVTGKAVADTSMALVSGITLGGLSGETGSDPATLQLKDSTVRVSAVADGTGTKEPAIKVSMAMALGITAQSLNGTTTVSLDHSTVSAEARAEQGYAMGIGGDGDLEINLTRGSVVRAASVSSGTPGDADLEIPSCAAIALESGTVTLDETSSLNGGWAVFKVESSAPKSLKYTDEEIDGPVLSVNNKGLISGRLKGVALDNAATGVLQADFGSTGDFAYSPVVGAANTFYFETETANLADGTTFRIIPDDGLGFAEYGESKEFALLESDTTLQAKKAGLNLEVKGNSPLLGLSWVETKSDKELVARIRFLEPAEAGLTGNAIGALNVALADMPKSFVFGTDPESWNPNVSGAFLTGMTQTLGASHANIGNRLGGLMGLNSGDEIVSANGLWYNANFTDADQGERDGIVGFDSDTVGLSLGCDRQVGSLTLGVAFTQGKTEADADDNSSEMDMDDNLFSLYGCYDGGKWFGEAVLSAGVGDVESVRCLDDKIFTADYDSTSYNAIAKVGLKLSAAGFQINPLLVVDYSYKEYDSYTEAGGKESGALEVDSQDYTVVNVGGGATLQRSWVNSWGVLTPEVSAMVRYDLEGDSILTTAKFVGGSTAFVAHGADPAETSWELSTALTVASIEENAVSVRLGFDYAGREDFNTHSVSGKVRFEF